jgi:hypothetical protein
LPTRGRAAACLATSQGVAGRLEAAPMPFTSSWSPTPFSPFFPSRCCHRRSPPCAAAIHCSRCTLLQFTASSAPPH